VNADLLRGARVRFIASATAGTDHVDFDYLHSAGIAFAHAPGCNANSVKEYVVAALLLYAVRKDISLRGKTLAVIGVGAIGSKVVRAAEALGLAVLQNDPPLARATGDPKFVSLNDALSADFVTVHTPLTAAGLDPTYHLFDGARFGSMKPTSLFINASRGAVVDTAALKRALQRGTIADALLDVWEDEPGIDAGLARQCALATAHVAGYSMDGKLTAVQMVHAAVCRFFGVATSWNSGQYLRALPNAYITATGTHSSPEAALHDIVRQAYDVAQDDRRLRSALGALRAGRAAAYTRLRTGYPARREFSSFTVALGPERQELKQALSALGFATHTASKHAAGENVG
jgi:erythronate-4-phosphate dehydrogenase